MSSIINSVLTTSRTSINTSSDSDISDKRYEIISNGINGSTHEMSRKRQIIPKAYSSLKRFRSCNNVDVADDDDVDETVINISDIRNSFFMLRNLFPKEKFLNQIPPIVLKHQLYSLVENRTTVDKELDEILKSNEIKMIRLGPEETDFVLVLTRDYVEHVRNCYLSKYPNNNLLEKFLKNLILNTSCLSFDKKQFLENRIVDEDISVLMSIGTLTSRDVGSYWLSIPSISLFTKALHMGRKSCLTMVKKSKYKEILQTELEKRKLPKLAKLGILYHIYDIIGADLVSSSETTSGTLIRIKTD